MLIGTLQHEEYFFINQEVGDNFNQQVDSGMDMTTESTPFTSRYRDNFSGHGPHLTSEKSSRSKWVETWAAWLYFWQQPDIGEWLWMALPQQWNYHHHHPSQAWIWTGAARRLSRGWCPGDFLSLLFASNFSFWLLASNFSFWLLASNFSLFIACIKLFFVHCLH